MVGLGRMGMGMARRLQQGGHRVIVVNRSPGPVLELAAEGCIPAYSIAEAVNLASTPRVLWSMLPPGEPTDFALEQLAKFASKGDVLIDGGNSFFRDSMARGVKYESQGLYFCDVGTSGGVWGLARGFALHVGGTSEAVSICKPLFDTLAPVDGWAHLGKTGAGHFAKMAHNSVEYVIMEAIGQVAGILRASEFDFNLAQTMGLWNHGSVIQSWLVELAAQAFTQHGNDLSTLKGYADDTGEARWTVKEAVDLGVPFDLIAAALSHRFDSREGEDAFSMKVVAALRQQFGGHAIKATPPSE